MIDLTRAKMRFDEYVSNFDMSNKMIKDKYYHTYRVCELSKDIAKSLNLNEEDTSLAYLIALLHDIGRFLQAKDYNTFNDLKSVDHAYLGYKILFEEGLIRNFIDDDFYDDIIKKSILNHNKYEIQNDLNDRELLHSKIIRDIDKLDIIYNVVNLNQISFKDDDSFISCDVKEKFKCEKSIIKSPNNTKNDSLLIMLAFVFDLNFNFSYEYYKKHDLVNKMYSKINNKDLFKEYIDILNNYIERKMKYVR